MKRKGKEEKGGTSSCLMVLEPRIMYEGAAAVTGAELLAADPPAGEPSPPGHEEPAAAALQDLFGGGPPPPQEGVKALVFVAGNIKNYQDLVAGVSPGTRVIVVDPSRDGVPQISATLSQYHDLDAVHIVSHGGPAYLRLGQQQLSLENLAADGAEIKGWGRALGSDGDILLYGCDVAAGAKGEEFVRQMSGLTGADVAASTDITGAPEFGGDWDLEQAEGRIEATLWGDVSRFHGVLIPPTVIPSGGTLNYTEDDAATVLDSTITVSDPDSPTLASAQIAITGNYASHQDELVFTDTGTITGSWNQATGTLTLTGGDTVANYQLALRAVKYINHDDNPVAGSRVVTFTVNDGSVDSAPVTSTINITAVNDAPTVEAAGALVLPAINEGTAASPAYSLYDLYNRFGFVMDDPDYHDILGVAVTGANNSGGTWQYSTDGGTSWNSFAGNLSDTNATLLKGFQELAGKVTNSADLVAGDLLINGTDLGPVVLTGSLTYGLNMQGAYNLATAINAKAAVTEVTAEIDTLYAGIAAIGSNVSPETIEFDLNGTHVSAAIPANSSIYQVARAVADAVNALPDRYDLRAWVGSGGNGGMANSVVIEHYGSIVVSSLVETGTAKSGLAAGSYALDASHNRGEVILVPSGGSYTVTTSAGDDSILSRVGLDGGVATTYVTGDAPADGAISVNFSYNKLRFVPSGGFSGTTSLTFRPWDQTNGLANGQTGVNVSGNGGTTPYSSDVATLSLTVKAAVSQPFIPPPIQPPPEPPPVFEPPPPPESLLSPIKPLSEAAPEPPPVFEPPPPGEMISEPGQDLAPAEGMEAEVEAEGEEVSEKEGEEEETGEEEAAEEGKEEGAEEEAAEGGEEAAAPAPEGEPAPAAEGAPPPEAPPEGQGEAGLNEQLAREAGKAAAERAEIVKIFEEVYELLQCK